MAVQICEACKGPVTDEKRHWVCREMTVDPPWGEVLWKINERFDELHGLWLDDLKDEELEEPCPPISSAAKFACIRLANKLLGVFGDSHPVIYPREDGGLCMVYFCRRTYNRYANIEISGDGATYRSVVVEPGKNQLRDVPADPAEVLKLLVGGEAARDADQGGQCFNCGKYAATRYHDDGTPLYGAAPWCGGCEPDSSDLEAIEEAADA